MVVAGASLNNNQTAADCSAGGALRGAVGLAGAGGDDSSEMSSSGPFPPSGPPPTSAKGIYILGLLFDVFSYKQFALVCKPSFEIKLTDGTWTIVKKN